MNRPRIPTTVSAILASTAGFIVLSRWHLAGTITGAVVVPVIYTLVSHSSTESLDRCGRWVRRRFSRKKTPNLPQGGDAAQLALFTCPAQAVKVAPLEEPRSVPAPKDGGRRLQWLLTTFAFLALTVSVYTLVQPQPAGKTILREKVIENRIIEKTVTVTAPGSKFSAALNVNSDTPTTTAPGSTQGGTPSTVDPPAPAGDDGGTGGSPTTTTTSPPAGAGG
jgi:hypothetical protein